MNETHKGINYDLAKAEADKVDEEIIAALQNGNSFRVEAGAGSGKTYSLNKAIEWLQTNKWAEYRRKKQTVVCITYTNAAVDVFVISKGWNLYQFETYAPMITGHVNVPEGKQASYERNRNLFYVCCSRPKKRLFFFVSVPIDAVFRAFLTELVGTDNIYTYSQYLKTDLQ